MYHAVCVIVIWSLVFAACIVFQTMNNVFWVVILYVGESYYYVVSSIFKVKVMAKCQWTQSKGWGNACYYSKLCCNSFYRCGKYPIIQNLYLLLSNITKAWNFQSQSHGQSQWTNSKRWEAQSFFFQLQFFFIVVIFIVVTGNTTFYLETLQKLGSP